MNPATFFEGGHRVANREPMCDALIGTDSLALARGLEIRNGVF